MYYTVWPYPLEWDKEERIEGDVLVLGGGIAGCMAAISAAKTGQKVILIEKGATKASGAGGSGCDHWESAATNPCSKVTPEELTEAMLEDNDGFNNGISHYIECREGYDRLLDIEKMGGKIRDTEDEFLGADFRDEATKLMFAYDYKSRFTLRIWGTTFKEAMYKELKRLGVIIYDRVMVTALLTEDGKEGSPVIGATGLHTRTGRFYVFKGKASIMCMSRPARIWLFSPSMVGLSEFRPTQCVGNGHAMGWRVGSRFNMMEKSVKAEFSAAGRSYPPYGAGNNHNTWYPATILDATGREVPYVDRDGKIIESFKGRCEPSEGQKFFMKGGNIEQAIYAYDGPETIEIDESYKLPLYADLSEIPELERKVIWGMMVGEEGKTKIPILKNYTDAGFDPAKHVLQCYGTGWKSSSFLPQERQLFGLPGGFMNDWKLQTNLDGLFVAGDSLFASNCYGHAAATGHYAGRHAAKYASTISYKQLNEEQIEREKERVYKPLSKDSEKDIGWKELNMAISKTMQNYCGEVKTDDPLYTGLNQLEEIEQDVIPNTYARHPHELTRLLEVYDILTVSKLIIHASLARKASSKPLCFKRGDEETDSLEQEKKFITIQKLNGKVLTEDVPLNYFGNLKENYEKYNQDYILAQRRAE